MVENTTRNTCGGYTIIKTIGVGGNAPVKLVEKDGQQYAMKIMTPGQAGWQSCVDKTRIEFNLLKERDISSIVKYLEFNDNAIWTQSKGKQVPCIFLVMEFLRASEMLEFINEMGDQDDSFFRYIFLEIANGIHQVHKGGLAHRDIKLDNVMITEDCEVKIIDFGFGKVLQGRKGTGFMSTFFGTEMYMAPELLNKK